MAAQIGANGSGLSDALTILGAAGIVIPAFARLKITPVIGFILVGVIAGPYALGALSQEHHWLHAFSISDSQAIEPFAEFGIILLLFSAGLHINLRRLRSLARTVIGSGSAELLGCAALIALGLNLSGRPASAAVALGLALAMSSTALVLPIAGTEGPVGRTTFAMLMFEDLALVPMLFVIELIAGRGDHTAMARTAILGLIVVLTMLVIGRFALRTLFAQAARTKSPEIFLAISLLTVILASLATEAVGLSPILGALIAGVLIAETEYHAEVEAITAPLVGLALGIFLITVGMRIDLPAVLRLWPLMLGAAAAVLIAKAMVTALLVRLSGVRMGAALETGVIMASPSETSLIVLATAAAAGIISAADAAFWSTVTALGLTVTPLLAAAGKKLGRRIEQNDETAGIIIEGEAKGRIVIFGFGRVGHIIADMLITHKRPYLAVDSDIDGVRRAREAGYSVLFGDVRRPELADKLHLGHAAALVLTMDDPVLTAQLARKVRGWVPNLPVIARARDTNHAAQLYRAGVTDAVPEALEASLQLAEAVLVDVGAPMGPVIASIHEKRSELRSRIMAEAEMESEPRLGSRRVRDSKPLA
ncbi:MAG TPA: cation:proton antiporter [Sphingomicrobium sp.]|nr:cation:proton antiporter [Sphingomicrobium sp.]